MSRSRFSGPIKATIIGGAVGASLGVAFYFYSISGSEAIAIMQSGRVGGMESVQTKVTPQLVVDRRGSPQMLIDKMQTPRFTQDVANDAGMPDAALGLSAVQYGGRGRLRARSVSDGTLVEIRAKANSPNDAVKLATSAIKLAMESDRETLAKLRSLVGERISDLKKEEEQNTLLADALTTKAIGIGQGQSNGSLDGAVLISASDVRARLQAVKDALWALQTGLAPPMSQETLVFTDPTIVRPLVSSWLVALILGAFSGAVVGFAFGFSLRSPKLSEA